MRKSAGKSIHGDEVQQQSIIVINSTPVSNLAQGSHEQYEHGEDDRYESADCTP